MAKSYTFCTAERFKDGELHADLQIRLEDVEENPETYYFVEQRQFHEGFDLYKAHHDLKVRQFGKVYGKTFNSYLQPTDFAMYFRPTDRLALLATKRDVVDGFLAALAESKKGTEIKRHSVDLQSLVHRGKIVGAWFSEIQQPNLKTAGFFGPDVDRSQEFQTATNRGQLSEVLFSHRDSGGEEHTVAITKNGAVILYKNYATVQDELDIALQVFKTYFPNPQP